MANTNLNKGVSNVEFDPSSAAQSKNNKLMAPNAKEDMETVTGDNPQKAWLGSGSKPQAPFGPQGRNF